MKLIYRILFSNIMDSITIRLISNKFHVPSEIMELIDNYLLYIYKKEHSKKLIIKDLNYILDQVYDSFLRNDRILENMDKYIKEFANGKMFYYSLDGCDDSLNHVIDIAQWMLKQKNLYHEKLKVL